MKPKRILFGVLLPGFGGHTRTAIALAEELKRRGHTVDFVVDATADATDIIRAAGFRTLPIDTLSTSVFRGGFRRPLRDLARDGRYDAIHWFEKYHGIYEAAGAAAEDHRAFVWTVTSGGAPRTYHGLNRVVVFTRQVAEHARRTSPRTAVHVVPARVDLRKLDREFVRTARAEVRDRLHIPEAGLLIVRVARCSAIYLKSIQLGIQLTERLNREGTDATFLHAGFIHEPDVAARIEHFVNEANRRAGCTIARTETRDVAEGARYVAAADLCIASGRSALEALALRRPTLVAWGSQYLGMVDEDSIQELAEANFQGWSAPRAASDIEAPRDMHDAVLQRLADPGRSARIQDACARFIEEHYSLENAAAFYEALYEDRTVTVDSRFRHYSNPRHLLVELRGFVPRRWHNARPIRFIRGAIR